MKRMLVASAALAVMLSACGGGGGGALVKECVDGGQPADKCQCFVGELQKNLDGKLFQSMVLEAEGKTAEAEKLRSDIPPEKQMAAMGAVFGAVGKCGVSMGPN